MYIYTQILAVSLRRKFVVKPRDTTTIREGKNTETGNSNSK